MSELLGLGVAGVGGPLAQAYGQVNASARYGSGDQSSRGPTKLSLGLVCAKPRRWAGQRTQKSSRDRKSILHPSPRDNSKGTGSVRAWPLHKPTPRKRGVADFYR